MSFFLFCPSRVCRLSLLVFGHLLVVEIVHMIQSHIYRDPASDADKDNFVRAVAGYLPPSDQQKGIESVDWLMRKIRKYLVPEYTVNELVYAFAYVGKLRTTFGGFSVDWINKITLCCCMLANKQNHDVGVKNSVWFDILGNPKPAGFSTLDDLNNAENEILCALNYITDLSLQEYNYILNDGVFKKGRIFGG